MSGTVGRGGRNAAEILARGGHRIGHVAVFRAAFAHDAADLIAVTAIYTSGIVAILNRVVKTVVSHHAAYEVVLLLGFLGDTDTAGVETA